MRHYLRLGSLLCLLSFASCAPSPYRHLQEATLVDGSAMKFKPIFEKELYRCVVDGKYLVKKFHLTGVLFFKEMPDSSTRVVFQNEMGFAFFDFEWSREGVFNVNQVIPQLDKKAVVKVLQKDIEMLLMKNLSNFTETVFWKNKELYHRFPLTSGYAYYITPDSVGAPLLRIENAGEKKKVTTISLFGKDISASMPDSVFIKHHRAHFTIQLTKITEAAG